MKYKIKISRKISQIDDITKWDELADFCFLKTNLLKLIEDLPLCKQSYFIEVYDKKKLVSIAAIYGQDKSIYSNLEENLYGKYLKFIKPLLGLNPSLLCHLPYSPFYDMFRIREGYNKIEIFNILSEELKQLAIKNNYKSYGFLGMYDKELETKIKNLKCIFSGFKNRICISKNTFEEHIESIERNSHRSIIRKERRLFLNSKYKIEKFNKMGKYKKRILKLFRINFSKYDLDEYNSKLAEDFLLKIEDNLENVTYFICLDGRKIISALMIIEDEKRIVSLRIGQLDSDEKGFPFFNLAIYEPLIYAIHKSKKCYEIGTGGYKYKSRRSSELYETCSFINSTNKLVKLYLPFVIHILNIKNKRKHYARLDQRRD